MVVAAKVAVRAVGAARRPHTTPGCLESERRRVERHIRTVPFVALLVALGPYGSVVCRLYRECADVLAVHMVLKGDGRDCGGCAG
eukprot:5631156-Prymnesium_polylepis.2